MDWSDTTEQDAFRAEVRQFIQDNLPPFYKHKAEEGGSFLEDDWQMDFMHGDAEAKTAATEWKDRLQARAWVAPHWPEEYGGAGLSTMEQFIFNEEMARAGAPSVGGQGLSLLGPTLLVHGTDEQKKEFLEPTLKGDMLWAQGFSEPGAGSDLASLAARAVKDGDEYVINGQKMWTSTAHKSNWIFGMFRTDPDAPKHRGISFFVMSMDTPGISVQPIISMSWEHATNETFYEDVRVPARYLVGEENRGWYVGMTLLDFERSGIGGAVGIQQDLRELTEFASSDAGRGQFGHRLPLARIEVADRLIESEVLYNFSMRIASMQARGIIPNYEASMAKIVGSETNQRVSRTSTKVFGLYSNIWDAKDERAPMNAKFTHAYVNTVVFSIFGGSNEIQRNIISTRGLGLPRG